MSARLKSGQGGSSPLEEPRSPVTSAAPTQLGHGRRGSGASAKASSKKEKHRTIASPPSSHPPQREAGVLATNERRDAGPPGPVQGEGPASTAGPAEGLGAYREHMRKQIVTRAHQQQAAASPPKRPSPIEEESSPPNIRPAEPTTASTESNATVRAAATPGMAARTPSYPFPRMATPGQMPSHLHRPFTLLSPTTGPEMTAPRQEPLPSLLDRVLSGPSTPASTLANFLPPGAPQAVDSALEFPSPNLYELSLMLSAEPGLDAWWNTVVQIMTEVYRAERVTLAVPADTTDIENVPWGQKATYNCRTEDELSLAYLARGSSAGFHSAEAPSESASLKTAPQPHGLLSPLRPSLPSRHSFSAFEVNQADGAASLRRPNAMPRSKSTFQAPSARPDTDLEAVGWPGPAQQELNSQALEELAAVEDAGDIPHWEQPLPRHKENKGRVLPVLQALDYEADPLIDHNGIRRVLERGKVIALTRSYPYLEQTRPAQAETPKQHQRTRSRSPGGSKKQQAQHAQQPQPQQHQIKKPRPESASKLSSLLGGAYLHKGGKGGPHGDKRRVAMGSSSRLSDEPPRPPTPKYEEYEQAPPSPWSQSPAPSPAIRADAAENPFFSDAVVDEDSFNPASPPVHDYSAATAPETIGVDNSWTVLHVPLPHLLHSRHTPAFRLDASSLERKSHRLGKAGGGSKTPPPTSPSPVPREKHAPIAVLSILSPLIPYPTSLRHSLSHLAPHLATSFSLCRHYSNLETELAGLQRHRPESFAFGAHGADALVLESVGYHPDESRLGGGGSITSPSDYSMPSRSATGSAIGTPSWDVGSLGFVTEKRQVTSSPLQQTMTGDSYFGGSPSFAPSGHAGHTPATPGGVVQQQQQQRERGRERESQREEAIGGRGEDGRDATASSPSRSSLAAAAGGSAGEKGPMSLRQAATKSLLSHDSSAESLEALREHGVATDDAALASAAAADHGIQGAEGVWPDAAGSSQGHTLTLQRRLSRGSAGTSGLRHPTHLHSHGADFSTTFQSLPPSSMIGPANRALPPARRGSSGSVPPEMLPPSDKLKGLILDSLPAHVFVAVPPSGNMVWVNSRYLSYRGATAAELAADPYGSIHPDERDEYMHDWVHSLRTGEPFSRTVRIRRFDGAYRYFQARAIATRDKRNVAQQFLGSYMDIHDQHTAELKAARQEEIETSEAKHRLLANLIPQIIFTATEDEGIIFANEQWLSYTGQSFESSLGLGFMDFVHPDDLAQCRFFASGAVSASESKASKASSTVKGSLGGEEDLTAPPSRASPAPGSFTPRAILSASFSPAAESLSDNWGSHNPSRRDSFGSANLSHIASSRSGGGQAAGTMTMPAPTSAAAAAATAAAAAAATGDLTKQLAKNGVIKAAVDSSGRLAYTTEVRLRSKSGEYRWHLIRCVETGDVGFGGSGATAYFGSATDINDHKLLEAKLKEAMESKSRFLSNMSHEIRTPLIGISGMVSFLQETKLDEEQLDYTNTIQTSANNLIMIINDILDLSKVDAGMMKLKHEWFHTPSLIEAVNELVSSMAITKRLELNYIVEPDVPAWVKGDKVRIRQVLLNVIGNAIKFTAEGEVFSRCSVVPASRDRPGRPDDIVLEFSITDTGKGFTKDEAELIFKPFSQIDGSSTRQHGGSGLGLVISRQLVELHGGTMVGTAVPGKGSTFTFTARFGLPTEDDHPPDSLRSSAQPDDSFSSATAAAAAAAAAASAGSALTPGGILAAANTSPTAASATRPYKQASIHKLQQQQQQQQQQAMSPPTPPQGTVAPGPGGIVSPTLTDPDRASPAVASSGSSEPSFRSAQTFTTQRSSMSSLHQGSLISFSEAARASGQDLSQMKLEMPSPPDSSKPSLPLSASPSSLASDPTATPANDAMAGRGASQTFASPSPSSPSSYAQPAQGEAQALRPLLYSILIISPQTHSREATTKHIEMTLPKDVPHQITSLATAAEAQRLIGGGDPVIFTHVVVNLPSAEELVGLLDQLARARPHHPRTAVLVLTDSVQRQAMLRHVAGRQRDEELLSDEHVTYIYKPVKPSRFAAVFDPSQERDLSVDRNRSSAQQMVETQRQSYLAIEARLGHKGYRVLLVEDNLINQKVLIKYLKKVGVEVDVAVDGEDCIDKVFDKGRGHYALILCDLHMPKKDGYAACMEIREWEAQRPDLPRLPIIALSANVMSEVQDKCTQAGFDAFVTKPVDFIDLSNVLAQFF